MYSVKSLLKWLLLVTMMESSDLRVAVYWNLHKDCWSVQSRSGENYGKIIMHSPSLVLSNAEFVVRQAGRNKVLLSGDFAGIELRKVLAVAGQHDKTALLASGVNAYCRRCLFTIHSTSLAAIIAASRSSVGV